MFLERFPDIDVLVAPPLDHPSLQQRLVGDTIDGVRARIGDRRLVLAHPDGRLTVDRPDPGQVDLVAHERRGRPDRAHR
jgi:hypothetical protein